MNISHASIAGKSKIKEQADLVLGENLFLAFRQPCSHSALKWQRGKEKGERETRGRKNSGLSSYKDTYPIVRSIIA